MIKGMDALKRKVGSIKAAIEDGSLFEEAGREWVEKEFKPYAKQIAPVDTGEYRDSIDGEVNPQQIKVFADAPHSRIVEEGSSTHKAQPTVGPAFQRARPKLSAYTRKAFKRRFK